MDTLTVFLQIVAVGIIGAVVNGVLSPLGLDIQTIGDSLSQ